jgi:hypothetical protein
VAHREGDVGQSTEGVVEDRVYQEGGQVDDQEWGGHCH